MNNSTDDYINRYGRRGGRGVRPYFLIPKLLLLAILLGSYTSAMALWLGYRGHIFGNEHWPLVAISFLFRRMIIPALLGTLFFGLLLWLQHPRIFLARRWLQLKLLLILSLPIVHYQARFRFMELQNGVQQSPVNDKLIEQLGGRFTMLLVAGWLLMVIIVILGRLKPRLGQ
ncbi:MAG: hypothetical protein HJJLKODD_00184 [Phycisphaerae bacterium]|nr:hypothetical protein [Phycisphaerae bacterium]